VADANIAAISATVLLLLAFSTRRAPSEQARRGRLLLLGWLAVFVGVSYYLGANASRAAANAWSVLFWLLLAGWGASLRDRGLVVIGLVFAALYFAVSFLMPLLLAR
jgi:hypothetical protein